MAKLYARWIGLAAMFLVGCASAQESACLFGANQPAIVQVEFTYKTESDGNGTERGSGFIISKSGYILTNAHVVSPKDADPPVKVVSAKVLIRAGSVFREAVEADIVQRDRASDLALLRLPERPGGWPTVAVGRPTNLGVGARIVTMGFGAGGDLAIVPNGEKTAPNAVVDGEVRPWWQTNLALNGGNSGGPIFGQLGTVVGIAVAKHINAQQVTYVIPIGQAQHFLDIAEVTPLASGRCALFPECRHPTHEVERYALDELKNANSGWRGGGYNQPAHCADVLRSLQSAHPNSTFSFVRSSEESKRDILGKVEYNYFCEYRRREQPVFALIRSPACIQ